MQIVFIVFLQVILFSLFALFIRKLEEQGIAPITIVGLQRYSIFPALIFFAFTFKKEYVSVIIANPISICWIFGIAFFWGIGQYIGYIVLDSTSSLSFVFALKAFFEIPILVTTSILINHDYPNLFIIIAMFLLAFALAIKPTQHKNNGRNLLKYSATVVIALVLANLIGHAIDGAFYKNLITILHPALMFTISVYILITSITLNVIYFFRKKDKSAVFEQMVIKKNIWLAYSIPCIWFIASVPEGYSFSKLPLFTLSTMGASSFLIKIISDIKNKRISLNFRTLIFSITILLSLLFSTLSLG